MNNNWNVYKRKQVNIQKAIHNDEVSDLLSQHYGYLHSLLVRSSKDEDTFNDTFLKLTYCYQSDNDFIEQYKYYFSMLKGAYYRDKKVDNYRLQFTNDYSI